MGTTGLEPGTSTVSWWRSNQLSYAPSRRQSYQRGPVRDHAPILRPCSAPRSTSPTAGGCASTTSATPTVRSCVYVHGTPDSRRARHPDDDVTGRAGVRLIAVDRPGAGGSSPHPDGHGRHVRRRRRRPRRPPRHPRRGHARLVGRGGARPRGRRPPPGARRRASGSSPGCRRSTPTPSRASSTTPAITAAPSPTSAAEMSPPEVGELLAPLVAPYPCDLELAREYVLEGADDDPPGRDRVGARRPRRDGARGRRRRGPGPRRAGPRHRPAGDARPTSSSTDVVLPGAPLVRRAATARRRRRSATGSPPTSRTPRCRSSTAPATAWCCRAGGDPRGRGR